MSLFEKRDMGLDVMATVHLRNAADNGEDWTCDCGACRYLRAEPRIVEAIFKALKKEQETKKKIERDSSGFCE